ncbi:MAG: hypothetical protein P1U89_25310 [Verrucomicrobiales bacterium]|nr:hypothetical protein [Verrucomicrobiales bacterium]
MKFLSLSTVLLLALFAQTVRAHNNFFLPGDAFFSTSITREVIDKWAENQEKAFDFQYSRFDGKFQAAGNLGYTNLKLKGLSPSFKEALTKAYWRYTALHRPIFRLESDDREDYTQINGVVALIYRKDFEGPLGLKLNENWQIEGLREYGGFFQKADPVIQDWRLGPERLPLKLAEKVPPLAHIPLDGEDRFTMKTPVVADLSDIKIILVGFADQEGFEERQTCPNLQKIYDSVPGTEYMIVDEKGFTHYTCDEKGNWQKAKTEKP